MSERQRQAQRAAASDCPVCGCDQVEGGPVGIGGPRAFQEVSCCRCGASWTNTYYWSSFTLHDDGR